MPGRTPDRLLSVFSWACTVTLVAGVACIIGFLILKGASTLNSGLIFGHTRPLDAILLRKQVFGGLFPAMAGTFLLVLLSVGIALPLGVCAGIYLAEYAPSGPKKLFGFMVDLLAGIPSIVVGLFGFSITIFLHHFYNSRIFPCLLISALSLAFLVLPYIIKTTQGAIEDLPLLTRLTAPGLGASKLQNIFLVLVPMALSDMVSGVVLAIGRCAEDTAVIMLTGVVATAGVPKSVFSSFEALPFYIYYMASEYSDPSELMKGYGAALILLLICSVLFVIAHLIKIRIDHQTGFM